jgi:hypothetical protein
MPNTVYRKFKERQLAGNAPVNLVTANIKALLVDLADYTFGADHEFLSDVPVAGRVASSGNLGTKTFTNGTFDSADPTFTAATGDPSEALILYVDTGTAATSNLMSFIDGRVLVEVAVTEANGATTIRVEDLPAAIASGAVLTRISGTGDATLTTTAGAAAGARLIAVASVTTGPAAGAVYEYLASGTGLPVTPNGGDILIVVNAAGWFSL